MKNNTEGVYENIDSQKDIITRTMKTEIFSGVASRCCRSTQKKYMKEWLFYFAYFLYFRKPVSRVMHRRKTTERKER